MGAATDPLYTTDATTRLFDDLDGTTRAALLSGTTSYESGYISGGALRLGDTASYATYSDSWWVTDDDGKQDSGTIELYFRADTFRTAPSRPYACLLTMDERPNPSPAGGRPTLAVTADGTITWSVANGSGGYREALYSSHPPLYPNQWYHIAATWGGGFLRLHVNDTLVAESVGDSVIRADTFLVGASGAMAGSQGLAARGRIDRLRISAGMRAAGSFPRPLDVRIDSPAGGETIPSPFVVRFRATASDSRTRTVSLYADTDDRNFDGNLLASRLPDSGEFLIGLGLADSGWNLYAVAAAAAGADSAFYYLPNEVWTVASAAFSGALDPIETTANVAAPAASVETWVTVLLNGGGFTTARPSTLADSIGTGAHYRVSSRLVDPADTVVVSVWTRLGAGGVMIGLRTDTTSLVTASLPRGFPSTPSALTAAGATMLFLEFLGPTGRLYGDTVTTTALGETLAYTLEYRLSKATTGRFAALGFDTAPGSRSFAYFYADTIGAAWIEDTTVTVSVVAGDAGGIRVRVAGVTRDLPGMLGMASSASASVSARRGSGCVLTAWGVPERGLTAVRSFRELLLASAPGRLLVWLYATVSGVFAV